MTQPEKTTFNKLSRSVHTFAPGVLLTVAHRIGMPAEVLQALDSGKMTHHRLEPGMRNQDGPEATHDAAS